MHRSQQMVALSSSDSEYFSAESEDDGDSCESEYFFSVDSEEDGHGSESEYFFSVDSEEDGDGSESEYFSAESETMDIDDDVDVRGIVTELVTEFARGFVTEFVRALVTDADLPAEEADGLPMDNEGQRLATFTTSESDISDDSPFHDRAVQAPSGFHPRSWGYERYTGRVFTLADKAAAPAA